LAAASAVTKTKEEREPRLLQRPQPRRTMTKQHNYQNLYCARAAAAEAEVQKQ
jgi:hypothetical protein